MAITVDGTALTLRPSFAALVALEAEVGSLLALVERVSAGELRLAEIAALVWHCQREGIARERIGEAIVEAGLAAVTPVLRVLVGQIVRGL